MVATRARGTKLSGIDEVSRLLGEMSADIKTLNREMKGLKDDFEKLEQDLRTEQGERKKLVNRGAGLLIGVTIFAGASGAVAKNIWMALTQGGG